MGPKNRTKGSNQVFHFNEEEKEQLLYSINNLTENQKLIFSSPKNNKEVIALKEKLWSQILCDFVAIYPSKLGITTYNLKNLYQNVKRSIKKKQEQTSANQLETNFPFFDDILQHPTTSNNTNNDIKTPIKEISFKRKNTEKEDLQHEILLAWKEKLLNEDANNREIAALKKQKIKMEIENNLEIAALQKRKLLMEIENLQQKPRMGSYHPI